MEILMKWVFTLFGLIMYILSIYFGMDIHTSNEAQLFLAINVVTLPMLGLYWWACYIIVDNNWGY